VQQLDNVFVIFHQQDAMNFGQLAFVVILFAVKPFPAGEDRYFRLFLRKVPDEKERCPILTLL
jgi:hypothetical protein